MTYLGEEIKKLGFGLMRLWPGLVPDISIFICCTIWGRQNGS